MARTRETESRFKVLPTPEEWKQFTDTLEEREYDGCHGKIIVLDKTEWFNAPTRLKQEVFDIPIYAINKCYDYPRAIRRIRLKEVSPDWQTTRDFKKYVVKEWVFNPHYAHINISESTNTDTLSIPETDEERASWSKEVKDFMDSATVLDSKTFCRRCYEIEYQCVCAPIKQSHFYDKDLTKLKGLFQGQLQGQNSGSSFQTVRSVTNSYIDRRVEDNYGNTIKQNAPIVQLLTQLSSAELNDERTELVEKIREIKIPKNEEDCYVKLIDQDHYTLHTAEELQNPDFAIQVSTYYPIITGDKLKDLTKHLPKVELDVVCIGLGSAGSGILDQISRSTYFHKYLLVDFDSIESKNLRNQWYSREDVGSDKSTISKNIVYRSTFENLEIKTINNKFQEIPEGLYKTKYIISGFDSIECRLELLQWVLDKKIEAKYLLDARYADLASSLFLIDLEDENQVAYYKRGLESDLAMFKQEEEENKKNLIVDTEEKFYAYLLEKDIFSHSCYAYCKKWGIKQPCNLRDRVFCNSPNCVEEFKRQFKDIKETLYLERPAGESSCVKQNFIDIYKFSSSFFFAGIRELEDGNPKPFTHIEAQIAPLPAYRIYKK